ncbi:glycosyltransferase [Geomonas terrae]|uniref:Glycosyltransferase n=1 Tax=Geomonas terrae TaxID=2562681 RepID=A0A4S1CA95_9BACT|nr:glycosyltransferase family 2 protein [Geomonas terrae]TGU70205.1 glycosyltransferase [Geomonas terrae]
MSQDCHSTPDYSLIIPVYKNEENIDDLLMALTRLHEAVGGKMEVVFVVDGSPDHSYALLYEALPRAGFPSQLVALSRNYGSFAAIRIGLEIACGKYCAVMAADLQEPPELITSFFAVLDQGEADVVFGMRTGRDDGFFSGLCSAAFWALYRKLVSPDMPKGGVDLFGCNQLVRKAILSISEPNSSLVAQLFWVGFRRKFIPYRRLPREKGKSAWKFRSRFKYMLDSIFSYSELPVIILLWTGGIGLAVSFFFGITTLLAHLLGYIEVPGYTTLILLQVFFASSLLFTQGIIASYLWRAFENTKKRPLALVQNHTEFNRKD